MSEILMGREVDKSMLERGFAVPVAVQEIFSFYLSGGQLAHGEKRMIEIFLEGEPFTVKLSSSGFNKKNNPAHSEQWQILYAKTAPFARRLREMFAAGKNFFTLHTTDLKDVFHLESEIACDESTLESLLELPKLTDPQAALIEKFGLIKYRRANRQICEALKRNYRFRCQICGRNVGEDYGLNVVDCHHINYFSVSLNNDAANLLIVCPNHHRIIHSANPTFNRERKIYIYPNGREEGLLLNDHL